MPDKISLSHKVIKVLQESLSDRNLLAYFVSCNQWSCIPVNTGLQLGNVNKNFLFGDMEISSRNMIIYTKKYRSE